MSSVHLRLTLKNEKKKNVGFFFLQSTHSNTVTGSHQVTCGALHGEPNRRRSNGAARAASGTRAWSNGAVRQQRYLRKHSQIQ